MNRVMGLFIIVKVQSEMEIISLGSNNSYNNYYYSNSWTLLNSSGSGIIFLTIFHTMSVVILKIAGNGNVLLIFPFCRCEKEHIVSFLISYPLNKIRILDF